MNRSGRTRKRWILTSAQHPGRQRQALRTHHHARGRARHRLQGATQQGARAIRQGRLRNVVQAARSASGNNDRGARKIALSGKPRTGHLIRPHYPPAKGGRTSTRSASCSGACASERAPLTRNEHCSMTCVRVRPEGVVPSELWPRCSISAPRVADDSSARAPDSCAVPAAERAAAKKMNLHNAPQSLNKL